MMFEGYQSVAGGKIGQIEMQAGNGNFCEGSEGEVSERNV